MGNRSKNTVGKAIERAPLRAEEDARLKNVALSPEDILERAGNAEKIIENCRKNR